MSINWIDSIDIIIIENIIKRKFDTKPLILDQIDLTEEQFEFFSSIKKKYQSGYPLEYLLDTNYIDGLKMKLTENVLIPRPETFEWVNLILKNNFIETTNTIFDIGSGSGYISLLIANKLDNKIFINEISPQAVKVIRENLKINNIQNKTHVFEGDITIEYANMVNEVENEFVIFANLPYLPLTDKNEDNKIKYEPEIALFSGLDGLLLFQSLVSQIERQTQKPKYCFFELDPRNIHKAENISKKVFNYSEIIKIQEFERILICSMDKIELKYYNLG